MPDFGMSSHVKSHETRPGGKHVHRAAELRHATTWGSAQATQVPTPEDAEEDLMPGASFWFFWFKPLGLASNLLTKSCWENQMIENKKGSQVKAGMPLQRHMALLKSPSPGAASCHFHREFPVKNLWFKWKPNWKRVQLLIDQKQMMYDYVFSFQSEDQKKSSKNGHNSDKESTHLEVDRASGFGSYRSPRRQRLREELPAVPRDCYVRKFMVRFQLFGKHKYSQIENINDLHSHIILIGFGRCKKWGEVNS